MKTIIIESQFLYQYNNPEEGVTVGGTQRYAYEIGKLFKDLGWKVIYLTKACKDYEGDFLDIGKIIAFKCPFGTKGNSMFSKKVFNYCAYQEADLVCYSDIPIAYSKHYHKSFALQHGISWDNPTNGIKTWIYNWMYLRAAEKFDKIICVDTNFINWMREKSKKYFRNPESLVYVPNFANEEQFVYSYKSWNKEDEFILLYPRRFVTHRGYDLFLDTCQKLCIEGYNIKAIIACEDFANKEFEEKYPNYKDLNVSIVNPKMNEINELYGQAFLTFVPTRWSEGTSLSAIESIMSGCPVVVSDVGGLGNIVLPDFNGIIVPPSVDAFYNATKYLIENPEERNRMAQKCKDMREVFGIKRWREKIISSLRGKI